MFLWTIFSSLLFDILVHLYLLSKLFSSFAQFIEYYKEDEEISCNVNFKKDVCLIPLNHFPTTIQAGIKHMNLNFFLFFRELGISH